MTQQPASDSTSSEELVHCQIHNLRLSLRQLFHHDRSYNPIFDLSDKARGFSQVGGNLSLVWISLFQQVKRRIGRRQKDWFAVSHQLHPITIRIEYHSFIITIASHARFTYYRKTLLPESFYPFVHLLFRAHVKGYMRQPNMLLLTMGSDICTLHDFQSRSLLKIDEVGGKTLLRVLIFLMALAIQIIHIKVSQSLQSICPNSDMSHCHHHSYSIYSLQQGNPSRFTKVGYSDQLRILRHKKAVARTIDSRHSLSFYLSVFGQASLFADATAGAFGQLATEALLHQLV